MDRDLGTVEPGKPADLTLVDGDLFQDFDALIHTSGGVRGGVLQERRDLQTAFSRPTARTAPERGWDAVTEQMVRDGCCQDHRME
nr:hypothetical protein [Streptomyces luteolifulvus]